MNTTIIPFGVVVIPCWQRPAHLAALLRSIERARGSSYQLLYMFSLDRGHAPEILEVINTFRYASGSLRKCVTMREHAYDGPAFNILSAYCEALDVVEQNKQATAVILLEEDMIIAEDFFEFIGEAMALDPSAVAVSAARNQNIKDTRMFMMPAMHDRACSAVSAVYKHMSYQSIATAHRPEFLEKIRAHVRPEYFKNPIGYCAEHLPDLGLPDGAASQDGLIHRIIRRDDARVLYPIIPRAFHAGWYGYNRPRGTPLSDWRDGAAQIETMTSDQMNALADPRFRDIERCALIRDRVELKLI